MPTLTELKKTLERVLNDPDLKTETYARPLRAADLLTSGVGVRRRSIRVTAPGLRHAVKTVEEYEALELRARPPGPRGRRSTRAQVLREDELAVLPLDRINEVQVLGQLVEFLIRRTSGGSLERVRASYQSEPGRPVLALRLVGPAKGAILELPERPWQPKREGRNVGEQSSGGKVLAYGPSGGSPSTPPPGLTRAAEIHEDALIALGRLFSAK
jgi:hypothetical protein